MPHFQVDSMIIMTLHMQYTETIWSKFVLSRNGYEPLIDYLKGLCIIFVIINHCMPESIMSKTGFLFWGVPAVPIFLIIQVFHAYKKGVNNVNFKYKPIWRRIVWPFIIAESLILIAFIIKNQHFTPKYIIYEIICLIKSGGYGPGAYYPFIYLQFAILLPLFAHVFKPHPSYLCLIFIIISQLIETSCSFFNISQLAYRLLFLRYFFLFYLGYILAYKGFVLSIYTFCIALICLALSAYIVFSPHDFSPILYDFVNPTCHWFYYIFIVIILLFIFKQMYLHLNSKSIIRKFILNSGKYSYEIFLFQIVYFAIADEFINNILSKTISHYYAYVSFKILIPLIFCTLPVIIIKKEELIWKRS